MLISYYFTTTLDARKSVDTARAVGISSLNPSEEGCALSLPSKRDQSHYLQTTSTGAVHPRQKSGILILVPL